MGKKAHFIESKFAVFASQLCDKCNLRIADVREGKCFWNPNPRAVDRNICQNCYDVWKHDKEERWRVWQEKYASLKEGQQEVNDECTE